MSFTIIKFAILNTLERKVLLQKLNQVIFNYATDRHIEGNEIIYKKDLFDTYNSSLPLGEEGVMDVRPIFEKILKGTVVKII